jgi:hypothetical protein
MYLLDHALEWSGETALTIASLLTALVRYCAASGKAFSDLVDGDLFLLVDNLKLKSKHRRLRNDNTIRSIIQRSLHFIEWYQRNLYRGPTPLIGEENESPAIIAARARSTRRNRAYLKHRSAPPPVSTSRKLAIPFNVIEDIEAAIDEIAVREAACEPAARRYSSDPRFKEELNSYLYDRRDFMLWMMKRTGLRPSELASMPTGANQTSIRDGFLILDTMKRRTAPAPIREFPISEKDIRKVLRYMGSRERWIDACAKRCGTSMNHDSMFLSTAPKSLGESVGISGFEKDFDKLCAIAGYSDFQLCFSMFRHRFITDEVRAHLKQWEESKGAITIDADYRALLERVRVKTGHASVESLWNYIHLARETEGLWVPIDDALEKERRYRDLTIDLSRIKNDIARGLSGRRSDHHLHQAIEAIGAIISSPKRFGKRKPTLNRKAAKMASCA